jgi:hypothetical protein
MFTVENYLHPLNAGCLNFWAVVFILGHCPIDRLLVNGFLVMDFPILALTSPLFKGEAIICSWQHLLFEQLQAVFR